MSNPRQDIAFPDAALIRKGTPKQKMTKQGKDGPYTMEIQGKNLDGQGFRIHFNPGTEKAVAAWEIKNAASAVTYDPAKFAVMPDEKNYIVKELEVIVPAPSVWLALNDNLAVNEVYTAGRRFGLANDEKYLEFRDPATGEVVVHLGQPYKKFIIGEVFHYARNGKQFECKVKTSVRLRLVVKDMIEQGELVQFILKTTSWYDWQNIKKQLAGIQAIADSTNGGNASGVAFKIYRLQQDVVWNKQDGSAQRMKQWLINTQPDSAWVKAAFDRMGKFALTGNAIAGALMPVSEVQGVVAPDAEEEGDYEGAKPAGFVEGEYKAPNFGDDPALPNTSEALRAIYAAEAKAALTIVDRDLIPKVSAKATPEQIKEAIAGIRAVVAAAEEIPY